MDQLFGHLVNAFKPWLRKLVVTPREEQQLAEAAALISHRNSKLARAKIAAATYLDQRAGRRLS